MIVIQFDIQFIHLYRIEIDINTIPRGNITNFVVCNLVQ